MKLPKLPSLRTLNEWMVVVLMLTGLRWLLIGEPQVWATIWMVAATWRLGNTWTER